MKVLPLILTPLAVNLCGLLCLIRYFRKHTVTGVFSVRVRHLSNTVTGNNYRCSLLEVTSNLLIQF